MLIFPAYHEKSFMGVPLQENLSYSCDLCRVSQFSNSCTLPTQSTNCSSLQQLSKTYSFRLQQPVCVMEERRRRRRRTTKTEHRKTYCCEIKFITQSFLHVVQGVHKTRCLTLLNPSLASEAALCCIFLCRSGSQGCCCFCCAPPRLADTKQQTGV